MVRETYKKYEKGAFRIGVSTFVPFEIGSAYNYRRPTMKLAELRWCLTEFSFTNPSQFPDMF